MRYRGQGHDVTVTIPSGDLGLEARAGLVRLFEAQYAQQFGRTIPNLEVEIMNWTLRLATVDRPVERCPVPPAERKAAPVGSARVANPLTGEFLEAPVYLRPSLSPGDGVRGPALIVEDETTTVVTSRFSAHVNSLGYIVLTRTSR
jgi:N-methylhydantoinase A